MFGIKKKKKKKKNRMEFQHTLLKISYSYSFSYFLERNLEYYMLKFLLSYNWNALNI